ncbi:right-handed parallel beta-helix repeat-containing protein [Lutibacter sp. A80]|uniref:right-handed parallel beta-helix repeat-containing protein n=1 Tax=Lutibacter sp. A80 TaxID=2918453 RepID=UPI001F05CD67|nr:right-handed parallel beta-helix repeat-containing protein [Lutibacter sp. A80]UMB59194.1 right-handed parallel beta-helix repeat-containing protein [Lutibacter sp. A80]
MKKVGVLLIFLFVIVCYSCKNETIDIYVSPKGNNMNNGTKNNPFKTIEKALNNAQLIKRSEHQNIRVHLLEGDYHLTETLLITPELNNISIIGEGVDKVTIKGSKIIDTKWEPFTENIMVTTVNDTLKFDQLFINGQKQILARYPNYKENGGYWQGSAVDAIDKERVVKWHNPKGGFVHALHKGRWGGFHYQITSVNKNGKLNLIGGHQNNRPSEMHPKYRMVENIFEELDSDKEWYLDKESNKLYLWKDDNIDFNKAKIEVTVLKHLIEIKGSLENPVKNINISGVKFEHASRTFMEPYEPLLRSDWTIYRGGALVLDVTKNITIKDCEFTNLGGNVIFVSGYNRNTKIAGNHIYNCGASAVSFVGDSSAVRSPSFQYFQSVAIEDMDTIVGPKNELYPSNCSVENNLIHKIGRVEKQVAGVQISMAMKIHVKNNSIYNVPRAGINISEGTWGGHLIEYNDVFNTVLETSDHGSFNSWGRDRFWYHKRELTANLVKQNPTMPLWDAMHTTIIRNNRFKCDHGWDIDLDDGSSNYEIYNNLCLNRGIKLREGYYRSVKNNIMVNNTFHPHVWFLNSEDVFTNNIVMKKYADIRLKGWGKEVDYNLFPSKIALLKAQRNKTDVHSVYGNPMFINPVNGDFRVKENSPALKIGFENFVMDSFGVQKPELKAMAKQPEFPNLQIEAEENNGVTLKEIETVEEQSSYGTHSLDGVIVLKTPKTLSINKNVFGSVIDLFNSV